MATALAADRTDLVPAILGSSMPTFELPTNVGAGSNTTTQADTLRPAGRVYLGIVTALGILAIADGAFRLTHETAPLFTTFAILTLLTAFAKVNLTIPRSASTLSVCYIIDFTTLLLLGPSAATLTAAIGGWSQCTFRCQHRSPDHQTWFSVCALAIGMHVTGWTQALVMAHAGPPGLATQVESSIAAACVLFLANTSLVSGAIGLTTGQTIWRVWRDNYLGIWPGHLLGCGVAMIAASTIGHSEVFLLPFVGAILALTYGNCKGYITGLTDSLTDPLTDLPNLRYLTAQTARELDRSRRSQLPLALMVVDLDGFKAVNDTHGHRAGDRVLRQVAQCLSASIRSYDICARYGGDEFVLVLPGCSPDAAGRKAETLKSAISAVNYEAKPGVHAQLGLSVGVALYPTDGTTFEQLLAGADRRMYQDKSSREMTAVCARLAEGQLLDQRRRGVPAQVTERELRAQFLQAQKLAAVGQLASGVAHDFNNALTAILGYGELLSEQVGPDKPMGRDLLEIVGAAQHAAALAHQLLAFSRKQEPSLTTLDVNDVVRTTAALLRHLLGESIKVVHRLTDTAPVVADATQLEQVMVNLSINARDAMPQGGVLTFKTEIVDIAEGSMAGLAAGSYTVLTVGDTGHGMPAEVQARIFEPFFTTKAPGSGTGLGLAAVQSIVTQLGGIVSVDSTLGKGTVFMIYLPRARAAATHSEKPAAGVKAAVPVGGETILLVEDEAGVRDFATAALKRHGYRVLQAETAEAALELVEDPQTTIHMVLTDVVLPGIDGCELAARVGQGRPETPVLFTTGYGDRMLGGHALPIPSGLLLPKPFTARALLTKTRQVLDHQAA